MSNILVIEAGQTTGFSENCVYCHHGVWSLRATHFLRSLGVENAFSMKGGIEAWSERIDPEVPRY